MNRAPTAGELCGPAPADSSGVGALDARRAFGICLLVFAISFLGYSRTLPPNADEMMNYALTESLAKAGRLDVDQVSTVGANPEEYGRGGHRYSKYGPAQAVLAVPLYWLAQRLPIGAVDTVLLENHVLTALTAGLLYLLARRLGYRPVVAAAVALLFVFTTPAWVHAKRFFGEPTTALFLLLTVYFAVIARESGRRRDLALVGLAAGLTVAAKYVNVAFVAPVALFLALPPRADLTPLPFSPLGKGEPLHPGSAPNAASGEAPGGRVPPSPPGLFPPGEKGARGLGPCPAPLPSLPLRSAQGFGSGQAPRGEAGSEKRGRVTAGYLAGILVGAGMRLAWIAAGALPMALALGLYDWARFGSPLESGYARWEQFNTPLWEGARGLLFSPGKSIFVYAPVLLLLPFWGPAFWRRHRWLTALLLVVFALHLGIYGTWWVWWGAWAWGPRFLVPLMPLAVLPLAAGLERALASRRVVSLVRGASSQRPATVGLAALGCLAALGLAVQVLGQAVDHTIYMAYLLPLNSRPDTLTLYDLGRSPVLAQLQFLSRRWLDFAWIRRDGPAVIDVVPFLAAGLGVLTGLVGCLVLWRPRPTLPALAVSVGAPIMIAGCVLFALNRYYRADDPALRGLGARLAAGDRPAVVVYLAPDHVVPYLNSQKADLHTVGWTEGPEPLDPRLAALLGPLIEPLDASGGEVWLVSQYPQGVPSSGIEAWVGRRAFEVEEAPAGPLRLARYRVGPGALHLVSVGARFAGGVELVGDEVQPGSFRPGGLLQVTLAWRAPARLERDYTVFVHLVDPTGKLVAQQDGPPGDGYRPTTSWPPDELVADHHSIAVPVGAAGRGYTLRVGLYLLATGERLPVLDKDGKPSGDSVTLALE